MPDPKQTDGDVRARYDAVSAVAEAVDAPVRPFRASLAALLAGHVLQDGELVLMILRPSRWFILLKSMVFIGVTTLLVAAAILADGRLPGHPAAYLELGALAVAGRLMVAVLQWMSRFYVLTDLRIAAISGVFTLEIFDCPLRRVGQVHYYANWRERLLGLGNLTICPDDDSRPGQWASVARGTEVHERVCQAVAKAKRNDLGLGGTRGV